MRVTPAGEVTSVAAPIPAHRVAFAPDGGLWLAGRARLVHLAPGAATGTCDATGPAVRFRSPRRMSLAALRRGGMRYSVLAPAQIWAHARYRARAGGLQCRRRAHRPAPVRRACSRTRGSLRRGWRRDLAAGKRTNVTLRVEAIDADGNATFAERSTRLERR